MRVLKAIFKWKRVEMISRILFLALIVENLLKEKNNVHTKPF